MNAPEPGPYGERPLGVECALPASAPRFARPVQPRRLWLRWIHLRARLRASSRARRLASC